MERKTIQLNDNSDRLFIEPIPSWITRQGFILIVCIFLFLLISSLFIKYPQTITVDIYIAKDSTYTSIPFSTYSNISNIEKVAISTPFHSEAIPGIFQKEKAWGDGKNVVIPVQLSLGDMEKLRYKESIICSGEIIISNKSIMGTIIKN